MRNKLQIFDKNGFFNAKAVIETGYPFIFVIGARDTGKTYSSLKYVVHDNPQKFGLMRRRDGQLDTICSSAGNVFKKLNKDLNMNIVAERSNKNMYEFYHETLNENGMWITDGGSIGYGMALSTICNVRGFDGTDIEIVIYDEFIPELHERAIKNEFDALMNAYDTISRLREEEGRKPLQLLCLANSNDMANVIFQGLGITSDIEKMFKNDVEYKFFPHRHILVINLSNSPVAKRRRKSVLYGATVGTSFNQMSFYNKFGYDDFTNVQKRPITEFRPICRVGELCIFVHKSDGSIYIITNNDIQTPDNYGNSHADKLRFRKTYWQLFDHYMTNNIKFDGVLAERLFNEYITTPIKGR